MFHELFGQRLHVEPKAYDSSLSLFLLAMLACHSRAVLHLLMNMGNPVVWLDEASPVDTFPAHFRGGA